MEEIEFSVHQFTANTTSEFIGEFCDFSIHWFEEGLCHYRLPAMRRSFYYEEGI